MPVRTFAYGLLRPTESADLVDDQMRLAHRYRNVLVEIEIERRDAIRKALASHPDTAPIEVAINAKVAQYEIARQEILGMRSKTRKRGETPEMRTKARELAKELRELRSQRKEARKGITGDAEVQAAIATAEEHSRERVRQARKVCGVYWGTYLLQEADADRSRQEMAPPKFRRWNEEGRVSAQLQGGISIDELHGQDTQVAIVEGDRPRPQQRGRMLQTQPFLWLRVGSTASRGPVWAKWPMIYHRPLPPESRIKVVTVARHRRNCTEWRWTAYITVEFPGELRVAPSSGAIALNLGFCLRPDNEIRSGYLVADDGHEQEIRVPASVIDAINKSDSIRSIRDKNLDAMRTEFCAWRDSILDMHSQGVAAASGDAWQRLCHYIAYQGPRLPLLLVRDGTRSRPILLWDLLKSIHLWRSADRFRWLAIAWRSHRFRFDDDGYAILEAWRYRDTHLEHYETGMRTKAMGRRRETYRIAAAALAAKYRTLILGDANFKVTAKDPAPESDESKISPQRRQQFLASVSELRNAFSNAFSGRVVKQSDVDTTRRCASCQHINLSFDRLDPSRMRKCPNCHAEWDMDANNCRNHLGEHRRAIQSGETARSTKAKSSRPTRQERLRGIRLAASVDAERSHSDA